MVREATPIDITSMPDLARLADEVARTQTPRILQRGGREVAVLMPPRPGRRRRTKKPVSPEDIDAARAAFGGWKGRINAAQFKRELKAARSDQRPPGAR